MQDQNIAIVNRYCYWTKKKSTDKKKTLRQIEMEMHIPKFMRCSKREKFIVIRNKGSLK